MKTPHIRITTELGVIYDMPLGAMLIVESYSARSPGNVRPLAANGVTFELIERDGLAQDVVTKRHYCEEQLFPPYPDD